MLSHACSRYGIGVVRGFVRQLVKIHLKNNTVINQIGKVDRVGLFEPTASANSIVYVKSPSSKEKLGPKSHMVNQLGNILGFCRLEQNESRLIK
jgi:hypothetical protein